MEEWWEQEIRKKMQEITDKEGWVEEPLETGNVLGWVAVAWVLVVCLLALVVCLMGVWCVGH